MSTIAIIDDNTDQSKTAERNIRLSLNELGSSLKVISSTPFHEIDQYFDYIEQNDVSVLILDQMLNDGAFGKEGPVGYKGSQLVGEIRSKLPDFPIFALTVIPTDGDLLNNFSKYEEIIDRKKLNKHTNSYVPKFIRASKNFLSENIDELNQLNELTTEIAGGNNDPELLKKLQAIQAKIDLPLQGFDDRNAWLIEYEKQIGALEELNKLIKSKFSG